MSRHIRDSQSFGTSSYSQVQDWVEVSDRGIFSLIGFVLLGLMIWAFGFAVIKATVPALTQLTGHALREFSSFGGAKAAWAIAEGAAMGLLVLLLRRGWHAIQRRRLYASPQKSVRPQIAPSLAAGVAVGLMALAAGIGILPTVMEAGCQFDLTTGIPALLDATQILASGAGGGPGGAGEIDIPGGYAAIAALLLLLVFVGVVAGGAIGGSLGAIGLGALSGAVEGAATSGLTGTQRAGALESALSGAVTGAVVGGLAAVISVHLAGLLADADHWGPLVGFDIMAAVFTAVMMLLCRRSWDNPTGLLGNTVEAAKFVIVLVQYGLGFALAMLMLGGVMLMLFGVVWVWKWLMGS